MEEVRWGNGCGGGIRESWRSWYSAELVGFLCSWLRIWDLGGGRWMDIVYALRVIWNVRRSEDEERNVRLDFYVFPPC